MLTECCCCSSCFSTAVVAAAAVLVLLPAAVRHRLPDGNIYCWSIESDSSVLFLFSHTRLILNVPLGGKPSHLRPRFDYILGNSEHARSEGGRLSA